MFFRDGLVPQIVISTPGKSHGDKHEGRTTVLAVRAGDLPIPKRRGVCLQLLLFSHGLAFITIIMGRREEEEVDPVGADFSFLGRLADLIVLLRFFPETMRRSQDVAVYFGLMKGI